MMEPPLARNSYYRSSHWKALREQAFRVYGRHCSIPGCNGTSGVTVDHRSTRPNSDFPTAADVLGNLRVLCGYHDRQLKELSSGKRRLDGKAIVPGADHRGIPVDPFHHWHRS